MSELIFQFAMLRKYPDNLKYLSQKNTYSCTFLTLLPDYGKITGKGTVLTCRNSPFYCHDRTPLKANG